MWQRQLWRLCALGRPSLQQHCASRFFRIDRQEVVLRSSIAAPPMMQHHSVREYSGTSKSKEARKRTNRKMKSYTSFKLRFKVMGDGSIARAQAGKRHNASSKTKKQRRQLRQPTLVAPGYARIIKKLGFKAKLRRK